MVFVEGRVMGPQGFGVRLPRGDAFRNPGARCAGVACGVVLFSGVEFL